MTTEYYLDGTSILRQVSGDDVLEFFYDTDSVLGLYYNGTPYYYLKNMQGDVVGILDSTGTQVVAYSYDAWGAPLSVTGTLADTLGQLNPFRYRSYYYDAETGLYYLNSRYYDAETGLYYLNSRYYDAETGRFLNADGYVQTGQGMLDKNMFAYCMNNPVNYLDSNGELCISAIVVGVGALALGITFLFSADSHHTVELQKQRQQQIYNIQKEEAKKVYNKNTVGINNNIKDPVVSVTIDYNNKRDGKIDPNIHIQDSYKIKTKAEQEVILEVIMNSQEFNSSIFTRGKSQWLSEWAGHNALYEANIFRDRTGSVDLNELEWIRWDWVW